VETPKGKRALGGRGLKWRANIKIYLTDIGCGGMDWIDLVQYRPEDGSCKSIMNLWVT
jgi:hypothetical protein